MAEFMRLTGYPGGAVLDFCREMEIIARPLNPVVIYFTADNVAAHLERIAGARGREWVDSMERRDAEHHGLAAFGGSLLDFWREWNALQNEIFNRCAFPKLRV